MDKEFKEKLNKIQKLMRIDKGTKGFQYSIESFKNEDGLIKVIADKSEFIYQLKELPELYAPEQSFYLDIDWDDNYYLSLLNTIEGTIRHIDDSSIGLTDARVIYSLEEMVSKPELKSNDIIIKEINGRLRFQLSISDYTRSEVRGALRKVLKSAKRHNQTGGIRGYLDFIKQFIP
ncbi:MAG: hypothetical protein FJW61_06400 [Actinobacteria bacterium]|nr:hypothetical protein [Actinomycetota bacterium]